MNKLFWAFVPFVYYCFLSIGRFSCCHKLNPPNNAAAFSIPFDLRATTAPADVCSAVQEQ